MDIKGFGWKLNRKDKKALKLLRKGFTAQQVADMLYLPSGTVQKPWRPIIDMGTHFKSYLDEPKQVVDNSYMEFINT